MRRMAKLAERQAEMSGRKQLALFNLAIAEITRGRRSPLPHSNEPASRVEKLLEMSAKVPTRPEPVSPIQSGLNPARFQ